jgi:uncharacterized protein DUF4129
MSARAWVRLLSLVLLGCASFAQTAAEPAAEAQTSSISLTQYAAELDRLIAQTQALKTPSDADVLIKTIAPIWKVESAEGSFEISSEWLRSELGEWKKQPKPETLSWIVERLRLLRAQAEGYQRPPAVVAARQAELSKILADPEFNAVRGPSWLDRLKQRVANWFLSLLTRIFSSSAIPTISDVVVYGLIGIAVLALAYWTFRTLRDNAGVETLLPGTMAVSSKEWGIWMAEAHAAADAGRWKDAVHLAYWSGISYLETQGWWPPDRARTPREYVRLLPAASQHSPALRELTRTFEIVWYGTQPADAEAFSQTVAQLEKLGCQYR